jgi:hypothetical protein
VFLFMHGCMHPSNRVPGCPGIGCCQILTSWLPDLVFCLS